MSESETKQSMEHTSVMVDEVLEGLSLPKKRNIVDATLGLGGHTRVILEKMAKNGRVIGFDADSDHIKEAKKKLRKFSGRVIYIHSNFENLAAELQKNKVRAVDSVLFDLGLASPHVDLADRGFSFMREGELDMRFDRKSGKTAADIINQYSEKELIRIFQEYGEEKKARKLASAIRKRRMSRKFKSTTELAKFVEKQVGRSGRIHPATRIFQALRIEVNREMEVLPRAIEQAVSILKPGGRIVVISYHSLEDRIVKNMFKDLAGGLSYGEEKQAVVKLITKKPLVPTQTEVMQNPRSRSAKLRVAEKL